MRFNFSVIVLVNFDFLEPMTFIEVFGPMVGNLHMEVDSIDSVFGICLRGFEDQFETL